MATIVSYRFRPETPSNRALPRRVLHAIIEAADRVYLWQRRIAEREHLQVLDGRMLADIGLSRADVAREARKHFWQA